MPEWSRAARPRARRTVSRRERRDCWRRKARGSARFRRSRAARGEARRTPRAARRQWASHSASAPAAAGPRPRAPPHLLLHRLLLLLLLLHLLCARAAAHRGHLLGDARVGVHGRAPAEGGEQAIRRVRACVAAVRPWVACVCVRVVVGRWVCRGAGRRAWCGGGRASARVKRARTRPHPAPIKTHPFCGNELTLQYITP